MNTIIILGGICHNPGATDYNILYPLKQNYSHLNKSCFFLLASLLTSTMYHLLSLYLGNNTNSKYLLTSVILIECNSWSYNLSRFYQSNQVDFNLILYFFSLRVVIANKGKDVTAA